MGLTFHEKQQKQLFSESIYYFRFSKKHYLVNPNKGFQEGFKTGIAKSYFNFIINFFEKYCKTKNIPLPSLPSKDKTFKFLYFTLKSSYNTPLVDYKLIEKIYRLDVTKKKG